MLIEIFGYIGSALVVVSMLMSSIVKLRVVNTIGSIVSGTYALIVGALPLVLMNACLIAINVYNLFKLLKKNKVYDMVEGTVEDSYVGYFLDRYAEDIQKYFPAFKREEACGKKACIVCCDGNAAGLFIGSEKNGVVDVMIEYATPAYRDCSVGTFLYGELAAKGVNRIVYTQQLSDEHIAYLLKVGFVKENDAYVKTK